MRASTVPVLLLSLLCNCRPVVDRRLVTFFASPKKVTQKRRRKVAVPAGCPIVQVVKWEMKQTRCAQTASLLIHFSPRTIGSATCEFDSKATSKAESKPRSKPRSKARSKAKSKAKSKEESKAAPDCRSSMCLRIACAKRPRSHYGCVDLRLSHVALPLVHGRKWIRNEAV
jgi:hypothetical protein